jgi:hypothetical protein
LFDISIENPLYSVLQRSNDVRALAMRCGIRMVEVGVSTIDYPAAAVSSWKK